MRLPDFARDERIPEPARPAPPPATLALPPPTPVPIPPPPAPGAESPLLGLLAIVRPSAPINRLISADGTLNVAVGTYSDCTGLSPISLTTADLDPCFPGP